MQQYATKQIRNVVLLGHSNSGKTSLSETLLFTTGAITRFGSVNEGTTTSDFEPEEVRRKISISLSILPMEWKGAKINLLDAPGYADFVGEMKAGIRVADSGVVVVCAASGVEVGTELSWGYLAESNLPRAIFMNKMDRDNADFGRTLKDIQTKLGPKCIPVQIPVGAEKDFKGVVDLITRKVFGLGSAAAPEIPASVKLEVETAREKLIEAAVEVDDSLLTKYLEGTAVSDQEAVGALRQAITLGKLTPVFVGSAIANGGIQPLLDAIVQFMPSPEEVGAATVVTPAGDKLEPKPAGPLAALVFKTSADPYVGKLSYFRVYSGTIQSNSQVWNSVKGAAERLGQLFMLRGKNQENVSQVIAGDIGAVSRLSATGTGDTLATREKQIVLTPVKFPAPSLSKAVYPKSKADLDKMSIILPRLVEEDPTLVVKRDVETAEIVLSGLGETHLDASIEKMARKFGADLKLEDPKIPYKETITKKVKAEFKHKKQTGGHGQYGHVVMDVEPLPRGTGFEFQEAVVGGAVPRNFYPAVEKGVNEGKQEGVLAGYPVVDVRATLIDGSSHPVDSSEMAFKIASVQALRKGLTDGNSILLEPVVNLNISVPDSFVGDIISDLNTRRGRVMGMMPEGGVTAVQAQAPLAEVSRYAIDLRSLTQGRGTFTSEFDHLEEVPSHVAEKVIAARAAAKEAAKEA